MQWCYIACYKLCSTVRQNKMKHTWNSSRTKYKIWSYTVYTKTSTKHFKTLLKRGEVHACGIKYIRPRNRITYDSSCMTYSKTNSVLYLFFLGQVLGQWWQCGGYWWSAVYTGGHWREDCCHMQGHMEGDFPLPDETHCSPDPGEKYVN